MWDWGCSCTRSLVNILLCYEALKAEFRSVAQTFPPSLGVNTKCLTLMIRFNYYTVKVATKTHLSSVSSRLFVTSPSWHQGIIDWVNATSYSNDRRRLMSDHHTRSCQRRKGIDMKRGNEMRRFWMVFLPLDFISSTLCRFWHLVQEENSLIEILNPKDNLENI